MFTAALVVSLVAGQESIEKHSLRAPFFDGDEFSIPNWEFGGNAVVSDESIRLTPDRQNKRGNLWNKKECTMENWELTLEFSVTGQGKSLFGDGFAVWFTEDHGSGPDHSGHALGNSEIFSGLGIFVDTYDNHQEDHGHPWISAILNDGTKEYDHDDDGKSHSQGGCQSFFRNLDFPTYMRITYRKKFMTLLVETSIQGNGEWEECFFLNDVWLPEHAYFGATASTGDLADNHDIVAIEVRAPPVPSNEFIEAWKKHKAEAPIGSMEMAKKMQANAKKKKMKTNFDMKKVVSNHKIRMAKKEHKELTEGGSGMMWFGIIALVLVGGGVAFFMSQKGGSKGMGSKKYSSGGF